MVKARIESLQKLDRIKGLKKSNNALLARGIASCISCVAAMSAIAQEDSGSRSFELEEIIVTATKREQSVLDVPGTVTALGEDELKTINAKSFEDYVGFVPTVSFNQRSAFNRSFQPNIRGVQLGRSGGPTTAFYIDDTPMQPLNFLRIGLPDPNMYDLNRVEVLKGPQGTLYGSSALGGAIKIVPNQPDTSSFDAGASVDASVVENGGPSYEYNGMVNMPLVDNKLALRLVGTYGHDDGYIKGVDGVIHNQLVEDDYQPTGDLVGTPVSQILETAELGSFLNESDFYSVRAALKWTPNDQLTITPSAFVWNTEDGHGRAISPGAYEVSNDTLIHPIYDGVKAPTSMSSKLYNVKVEYDAGWADLLFSSTYFNTQWNQTVPTAGFLNRDGAPIEEITFENSRNSQDGEEEQYSFEARASTSFDGPLNGTFGVFYRDVDRDFLQFQLAPGLETYLGGTAVFDNDLQIDAMEEWAAFGELTYLIGNSMEVTAGLRYSEYDRDKFNSLQGRFAVPTIDGTVSEDITNFSVSALYRPFEDTTVFARVADGYRPGSATFSDLPTSCDAELISLGITPGASASVFESDDLVSYEAGIKTRLYDGRLSINATAFYIDWTDVQVDIRLDCAFSIEANASDAEVKGAELELKALPLEQLEVQFTAGLTDATLVEDAPQLGGSKGDPLPLVSEWTGSFSLTYYPESLKSANTYFRVETTYSDPFLYTFRGNNVRKRDIRESTFLTNIRAGFSYEDWEVSLYATNLFNKLRRGQCRDTSFNIIGERVTCVNEPLRTGLRINRNF